MAAVAQALRYRTLAALDVSANRIGCAGALRIADTLANNVSLAYLDMSRCGVGDRGAAAVASALAGNALSALAVLKLEPPP